MSAGAPERFRLMSGTGPLGVNVFGVWQSLQVPAVMRYAPRATWSFEKVPV
ncbi:MAG: hypothetical protein H6Q06_2195 [Acidobacteria bacterium]|nr:hypothetical protein [Acidobacteriota bacterium]